jgi:thiosulfate/3-mercaptopyruvate sulfurtransferase
MPSAAVQSLEQQAMNHSTPEHYNTLISVEELAGSRPAASP